MVECALFGRGAEAFRAQMGVWWRFALGIVQCKVLMVAWFQLLPAKEQFLTKMAECGISSHAA
jgi:hypothetical protein